MVRYVKNYTTKLGKREVNDATTITLVDGTVLENIQCLRADYTYLEGHAVYIFIDKEGEYHVVASRLFDLFE